MNVLIIGRNQRRLEKQIEELKAIFEHVFTFFAATSHVEMRQVFELYQIDAVVMSGGHVAGEKAHFVDYIIKSSTGTCIHIKDKDSGHMGMVPFATGVLTCLEKNNKLRERLVAQNS